MLIILLLFQSLFFCVLTNEWWKNEVFELTNHNIMDIVGKNKQVVIDFFTPWCYYCQKLNKDYIRTYQHFKDSPNVLVVKVNCEENDQICDFYKVHAFPTIIIVSAHNMDKYERFNGNNDFDSLNKWINRHTRPSDSIMVLKQNDNKQQEQIGFDYGLNSKQIFEFIFSIFEQMNKQHKVFNKKITILDQEIGKMKRSDEQIFERIQFNSQSNFNGLLAMIIIMIGTIIALISFYGFTKIVDDKGGYKQMNQNV